MKIKGFQDTIKWYDQNAENYATTAEKYPSLDLIEKFVSLLTTRAKVLDAGCGGGRDTKILNDKGINAIGIDISSGLLQVAKERYPKIKYLYGNFLDLPFKNKSFDGVWAHASLLHLETQRDVVKAIMEFSRVLKHNGILYILVKARTGKEKTAIVSDKISQHDRFFQYFTKREIKLMLTENGFKVLEIKNYEDLSGRKEVKWICSFSKKN